MNSRIYATENRTMAITSSVEEGLHNGMTLEGRLTELCSQLTAIHHRIMLNEGWTPEKIVLCADSHTWHWKPRKKFYAVDEGSSGYFLIERETGEIFNIKGYGVADRNKKVKANLGNIFTADARMLYEKRYNYLR